MLTLTLAGCVAGTGAPRPDDATLTLAEDSAPPPAGAAPGTCFARDRSPAVIETVTDQVLVRAAATAPDGSAAPAAYRTDTHQRIAEAPRDLLFETPCAARMTPELVATLQRALAARGLYAGPVDGRMTGATRAALRAFQKRRGLDSAILAIDSARALGLIAYGAG